MRCRVELLRPWPPELSAVDPTLALGSECEVFVWGTPDRCHFLDEMNEALESGEKIARDALHALASVVSFSTVPPRKRIPPPFAYRSLGGQKVKQECGIDEPLWKFGVQQRTRVRIFAADIADRSAPGIVLLALTIKSGTKDDWSLVRRACAALRKAT